MDNNYKLNSSFTINGYINLNWKNKTTFTSTQYYPAQLKERYGKEDENGWINKIFWGDNLQVMSHLLKEYRGKIKLIYIDPPFDSKADYKRKIKLKGKEIKNDINSFEEKQYTDIWSNDEYLQFMYERLILMRELLSDDGSIYLHCDWHQSHYLRCILEQVFGVNNFRNEIIWHYRRWTAESNDFQKMHDNILVFSKSNNYIFNPIYIETTEGQKKKHEKGWDRNSVQIEGRMQPQLIVYDEDKVNAAIKDGRINKNEFARIVKVDIKQTIASDVWSMNLLNSQSKERTGYPTQKPENLIEQIILSSSNLDDIVFDCFMGSGTTQNVALKLGRKFVGTDINLGSIETTVKRLINNSEYKGIDVYYMDNSKYLKESATSKIDVNEHMIKINEFYPTYLLQNLKLRKEDIEDWRELVDSIMIDFDYDGTVLKPTVIDIPNRNELVKGEYEIPKDANIIKVKIIDVSYKIYEFKLEIK